MNHLSYLATIFVFCGTALLIIYKRQGRILRKHEQLLLLMMALGVPLAAVDYFAIHWGAWNYSAGSTLNIRFATEIETYLFSAGIFATVAAATLVWATQTDAANTRNKRKSKRQSPKSRRIYARTAKAAR